MYTQHFGLEKAVFDGGIAQGDDLYLGPQQQRVTANLKVGLTTRDSIVTLTGCLGVGKTTIASEALRITATRMAKTWVGNTPLTPDEALELLLAGFELAPYDMGRVQRLHAWRQFMGELSVTDTRICILVENAFVLGLEALQALEALTSADPNDCPGANLVLMGSADLHELLEAPELAPLKQRIRSNQRLDPLTPQEVEQYLKHRITVVGGDYDTIFAPATAAMIHCFSAGVPRVINNVCETALVVAATRKVTQLTPHIIQRVAEGVYGLAPSVPLPEAAAAVTPVAAASPVATVEKPVEAPVPATEPAPAAATSPVSAAKQPAEASAPPADPAPAAEARIGGSPAPVDAQAPAEDEEAELVKASSIFGASDSKERPPEPPTLTEAPANAAQAEPLQPASASGTSDSVKRPPAPPVLIDEVDFDLSSDSEDVAGNAQPLAASLPPEAPAQSNKKPQTEEPFSEDIAAATHLHEISDEMAELLFREDQGAAPLDSDDIELTPERTEVVLQLDEDAAAEPEADAPVANTVVF